MELTADELMDKARQDYADAGHGDIKPGLALARLLLSRNLFEEAVSLLGILREHRPEHPGIHRLQGRALLGCGKEEQALTALGEIYTQAAELILRRLSSSVPEPGPQLSPWLVRLVLRREFRVLNGQASRQFMADRLSPGKQPITQGKDWFFQLKNGSAELEQKVVPGLTMSMTDACLMLQEGRPRVYNPLIGVLSAQVYSILPDLALLRDSGKHVWVSCVPKLFASTTLESVYLLPEERLILDTRNTDPATTQELLFPGLVHYLRHYGEFQPVVAGEPHNKGITVADRPLTHLAHYVWNGISAWSTILASGLHKKADALASWTAADYFGDPFELYPEFGREGVDTLRVTELDDAVRHVAHTGHFWLPLYERYIREDLTGRIMASCTNRPPTRFLDDLENLCEQCSPLIMLTVRLGNREWVKQEAGYINIVRTLAGRFPEAGFILDGMTRTGTSQETEREHTAIEGEMELARRIIAALDTRARIINAIGVSLTDSVMASGKIDMFIGPWGTGMVKYKWIANKPGIAFGNRLADEASFSGIGIRVFDSFRENGIKAIDIPTEHISDAGEGNHDHALRRNFDLPWELLGEYAASLLVELGYPFEQADPVSQ